MITGVGFTEILTIGLLILLFFGSKELPQFIREAGRLFARLRAYSDRMRRELDSVAREVDPGAPGPVRNEAVERKTGLRSRFLAARKALPPGRRQELSARITEHAMAMKEVAGAKAAMVYLAMGSEVDTGPLIERLQAAGARIVLPYCRDTSRDLGIAEVTDIAAQTAPGLHGAREPLPDRRDNFLRSDISVVICPGVAFDRRGGRLGRGAGYYDNFLRELSGRVPFVGLAFACQVADEPFPFDYHDVPMTEVVTEDGAVVRPAAIVAGR